MGLPINQKTVDHETDYGQFYQHKKSPSSPKKPLVFLVADDSKTYRMQSSLQFDDGLKKYLHENPEGELAQRNIYFRTVVDGGAAIKKALDNSHFAIDAKGNDVQLAKYSKPDLVLFTDHNMNGDDQNGENAIKAVLDFQGKSQIGKVFASYFTSTVDKVPKGIVWNYSGSHRPAYNVRERVFATQHIDEKPDAETFAKLYDNSVIPIFQKSCMKVPTPDIFKSFFSFLDTALGKKNIHLYINKQKTKPPETQRGFETTK